MNTGVLQVSTITNSLARTIIDAALAAAEAAGQRFAIAVVDAVGNLSAFADTDGVPVQAIQISQDKAYIAAGFGLPTAQWHELKQHDAPLALGVPAVDRLVPVAGEAPDQHRRRGRRRHRRLRRAL